MFGQVGTFFRTVGWQWRRIDAATGVIIVSTGFQVVCISYYSGNQFKERAFRVIPRKTGNFPPVGAAIAIRYEKYARHIFPRHCCTTPLPPPPPPFKRSSFYETFSLHPVYPRLKISLLRKNLLFPSILPEFAIYEIKTSGFGFEITFDDNKR